MRTSDLIASAVANTFRSKVRTVLTVLAIFVGAFTLTLTNGLGTGINSYIDDTVASLGSSDVLTVTKPAEDAAFGDGPREYDPDTVTTFGGGPPATVELMTQDDLDALSGIRGVASADPVLPISADYIQYGDGTKYVVGVSTLVEGQTLQLAAGDQPDPESEEAQVAIPTEFLSVLGLGGADAAIGESVVIAVTDGDGEQRTVAATVVGVSEDTFSVTGTADVVPNAALTEALYAAQSVGVPDDQLGEYARVLVRFDAGVTEDEVAALQDRLADAGYDSVTIAQQLGAFTAVIDGIVLVLNGFAIIALVAAGFGIVNTLLMSVQERTREIGLMKAMGMGSGRVFALFSLEATFIGFLGSAIGAGLAMAAGGVLSRALGDSLLADLPGLQLIAFDLASIASIILAVMAIAFLAGTIPAWRAARQDPVDSLRYE
ncbi:ABC transporter permease [Microbacter sp. GSS18]|nr:ABC transporter permease [Microbacter sp. GSS18]